MTLKVGDNDARLVHLLVGRDRTGRCRLQQLEFLFRQLLRQLCGSAEFRQDEIDQPSEAVAKGAPFRRIHLNQNYPNPFNPTTIITYISDSFSRR